MRIVEIIYRNEGDVASPRERPADAGAAQRRMDDGSRASITDSPETAAKELVEERWKKVTGDKLPTASGRIG